MIPVHVATTLILARLPRGSEWGHAEGEPTADPTYPGIRGSVAVVLRGWHGSAAWRASIAATAFRG